MKAIYPKFAAISFAALLLAACSDSTSEGGGNTPPVTPDVTSLDLVSQTIDASRVDNYKDITSKAGSLFTRAGVANYTEEVPEAPTELATALSIKNPADLSGADKQYKIEGQETVNFSGKTISDATIFVHGASTILYDATTKLTNTTIVLLSSAKLVCAGGDLVPEGCTIYCTDAKNVLSVDGDINITGNFYANFTGKTTDEKDLLTGLGKIAETTAAEKEKSITPTQNITFGSKANVCINGSIRAKVLNVESGANVYAARNLFNAWEENNVKKGESTIAGNLKLGGFIKSATLTVTGNLEAGAAVKVTSAFNVNDGALVQAAYINVTDNSKETVNGVEKVVKGNATLKLTGTGKIQISHKNVIVANNLVTDNSAEGQITLKGDNAVAVVKAYNFTNASTTEKIKAFATPSSNSAFLFQFTNNKNNETALATFEDLDIAASYLDYDKVNNGLGMLKLVNQEHKKYGYEWDETNLPKLQNGYKLDLVAAESTPADGQSATCIQPVSNNIYVSYHTYGNGTAKQSGNLERLTMSGNQLTLAQALKAENTDYNHLMVDGSNLYLAGSNKSGAILGHVTLTSGAIDNKINLYNTTSNTTGDANCVAKYGDNYVVATTKGFSVFDKNYNNVNYDGKEGKYVVASGNDLYTLALSNVFSKYTSADLTSAASTWNTTSDITPTDNKSVMAIDGNVMYVCKGENGIDKIDLTTGTATPFWTCPTFTSSTDASTKLKGHCNGIAVKGDFIYVAHGTYGLVVLDKQGNMICHRKAYTGKSANFVAVDDNYIYVAYGQSRVQVFKLTGTAKFTTD